MHSKRLILSSVLLLFWQWAGKAYDIQTSTDLLRWTSLTNLFSETGAVAFEAELDGPQRYYRAVKRSAPAAVPIPKLLSPQPEAVLGNGRSDGRDYIIWDFDWSEVLGASQYQLFVQKRHRGESGHRRHDDKLVPPLCAIRHLHH